ncbi:AHH domain-containing protein [Crossiella sp. S99.1]|nr:AHH domain-containing protein [Crossiella sp. S99.1]
MRYTDATVARLGKRDITTTEYGHQFGTFDWMGSKREVLTVDGMFYAKPTPEASQTRPALPNEKKWRTGDASDYSVYGEPLAEFGSPIKLAERLSTALDELPDLPSPDDADLPSYTANGVEALRAETSAGSLFVAKHAPYRVLRLEPYGLLNLPPSRLISMTAVPTRADPLISGSEGVDLTPIVEADLVDRMYDTLAERTKQLADAVDGSFRFDVANKAGDVECSLAGCTAMASFTGKLDPRSPNVRVASGQVTVTMSVAFTVNGRNAGSCTSPPASVPVAGNTVSAQMSCSAPQGGAIIADLKAQAEAQSRATGRAVPYNWIGRSQVQVTALASARTEIDGLLSQQEEERNSPACDESNSFVAGTLVLLADGTTRPIEQVTAGTQVRATDPNTGSTTARPVLAQITGTGQKQLAQLTLSDGQHTATLTATSNHPFFDAELRAWIKAGDLRPGKTLTSLPGNRPVRVIDNLAYQAPQTVYNLTVSTFHTYYVRAGEFELLAHNDTCSKNARELAKNLAKQGETRPGPGWQAHHIVPSTAKKAAPAQALLKRFGIDINDARNGIYLPQNPQISNPKGVGTHNKTFRDAYYKAVNNELAQARSADEVFEILAKIRNSLKVGNWP